MLAQFFMSRIKLRKSYMLCFNFKLAKTPHFSGYVKDVHHFYLLGVDAYRTYQKTATELFLMKQSERIVCPSQTCSAAFILLEEDNGEVSVNGPPMILCPECLRLFCRWCQTSGECKCDDQVHIAGITKFEF